MDRLPASNIPPAPAARTEASPTRAQKTPAASAGAKTEFRNVLEDLGSKINRGEQLVARAVHGAEGMSPGELLALQAGIYRYTEVVDLAAKLVDRASNAVKTTLQSQ